MGRWKMRRVSVGKTAATAPAGVLLFLLLIAAVIMPVAVVLRAAGGSAARARRRGPRGADAEDAAE